MTKDKQSENQNQVPSPSDTVKHAKQTAAEKMPKTTSQATPNNKSTKLLAIAAILISIGLSAGVYWQTQQQLQHADSQIQLLKTSLSAKEQSLVSAVATNSSQFETLKQQYGSQQQSLVSLKTQLELTEQHRKTIEHQLALLNIKDANHWRLNEANYLLQLAAYKLWLEHDPSTAIALLIEADSSVNHANDPHLLALRRAINNDVQALKAIPLVDKEGIAFTLESLLQQTETLQLAEIELPAALQEQNNQLSSDSTDWRDNLAKSWRKFSENFITVRRRDGQVEALIEPKHAWYLKENLKLQLQQAEQALFRGQGELFKAKLQRTAQWVGNYFMQNQQAQAMLVDLKRLQGLDIVDQLPEKLSSLDAAEQAIKDRQQRLQPSLAEGAE
ncbi:uroporphyrinogen-III C-methyltransferase [Agarivorans sp. QJM3NY_25]|uniref:uroporphyrinogen-III C-methyltransferase n=1 Tax=Agarivorans sp. QJM3NY_25 TaxID=3421430 RepID=UPI003D7EE85D